MRLFCCFNCPQPVARVTVYKKTRRSKRIWMSRRGKGEQEDQEGQEDEEEEQEEQMEQEDQEEQEDQKGQE